MDWFRVFDTVSIIFNPNSTGDAPRLARELHGQLGNLLPSTTKIRSRETQHGGHAIELARDAATTGSALVVSVSGDGGYNEVLNGVMESGNPDAACAVMAAGNANDHHRVTARKPLAEAIAEGMVRKMDLLRISWGNSPDAGTKYAHSYIGFGLTPVIAIAGCAGSPFRQTSRVLP